MSNRKRVNRWADHVSIVQAHGFHYLRMHDADGTIFAHARLRRAEAEELREEIDISLEADADDAIEGAPLQ